MGQKHKELSKRIRLRAQERLGNKVRLFERHQAKLQAPNGAWIHVHPDGAADIYGWVRVGRVAIHVEMELRVDRDKTSAAQDAWAEMCRVTGVNYLLAHAHGGDLDATADEVVRWLEEVCNGHDAR